MTSTTRRVSLLLLRCTWAFGLVISPFQSLQAITVDTTGMTVSYSAVQNLPDYTWIGNGTLNFTGAGLIGLDNNGGGHPNFFNMTGGTITIDSGTTLQNGGWQGGVWTNNQASMTIAAGGSFDVWDGNPVMVDALNGAGNVTIGIGGFSAGWAGNRSLTVGVNNGSGTFSGVIAGNSAVNGGSLSVTKQGTGTQTFSGINTYSGGTTVSAGTLRSGGRGLGSGAVMVATNATLAVNGTTGLAAHYFDWTPSNANLAQFDTLQNIQTFFGGQTNVQVINSTGSLNFGGGGGGFPSPYNSGGFNFGSYYSGMINIQPGRNGTYTFNTTSDDGSMLWIDGTNVVYNNYFQGNTTRSGTITLSAGPHTFIATFNQGGGGYGLNAQISGPGNTTMEDISTASTTGNFTVTPDLVVASLSGAGNVQLTTGGLITGGDNSNQTFGGVISDIGGLLKLGSGTQILSNNNTYSGSTTIATGTLQVGNGGTTGSLGTNTGPISLMGTLAFNRSDAVTLNNDIVGNSTGSLAQLGTGTLNLNGTNIYGGTTTISSGNVNATSLITAGRLTIASGSTLTINAGASSQGLVGFYFNNGANQANLNTLSSYVGHLASLTPTIVNATTSLNFNTNGSAFPAPYNSGGPVFESLYSGSITLGTAGTYTFNTSSDDGSMLYIDGQVVVANNFNQGVTTRTGAIALSAGTHRIAVAYNNTGGGYGMNAQISGPGDTNMVDLTTANAQLSPDAVFGSIAGAGNIVLTTGNLITGVDGTSSTFSGVLSGNGTLYKFGSGTQTLTGTNTYAGGTIIGAGTVQVGNGGTSGTLSTGDIYTSAGATLRFNRSDNFTVNNNINGVGNLVQAGSGTVTLSGTNSYLGNTTLTSGNVTARNLTSRGTLSVATGSTFAIDAGAASTGLTGSYYNNGANQADLNSLNGYVSHLNTLTPALVNSASSLNFQGNGSGFPAPYNAGSPVFESFYSGSVNLATAGDYIFNTSSDDGSMLYVDGQVVVTNNFNQGVTTRGAAITLSAGMHHLAVAYNNTGGGYGMYAQISGANNVNMVDINSTNVTLAPDASFGSLAGAGNIALTNGNILTGLDGTNTTFSGSISGPGVLSKVGAGTQTLAAANSFTGPTVINAGAINVAHANAVQNSTVVLNANNGLTFAAALGSANLGGLSGAGNLALQDLANTPAPVSLTVGGNNASTTYSGVLSGGGNLMKNGTGTLSVSGASTYNGTTQITGGTLRLVANQAGLYQGIIANGNNSFDQGTPFLYTSANTSAKLSTPLANSNATGAYPNAFPDNSTVGYFGQIYSTGATLTFGEQFDDSVLLKIDGAQVLNNGAWDQQTTGTVTLAAGWHTFELRLGQGGGGVGPANGGLNGNTGLGFGYSTDSGTTWNALTDSGSGLFLQTGGTQTVMPTTTAVTISGGGTLDLNGATQAIASLASADPTSQVTLGTGKLTTGSGNTSTTFAGVISGTGSLTKTGTGTMTVTNANTYTGNTIINGGKLLVNNVSGSGTGTGTVTVNSGGTLGGSGTIAGAVTIATGGTISPGNSPGTLGLGNGFTVAAGATYDWEHTAQNAIGVAGTSYDTVNVTGGPVSVDSMATTGSKLRLLYATGTDFTNAFWDTNRTWSIVTANAAITAGNLFDGTNIGVYINGTQQGSSNTITGQGTFTTVVNGSNIDLVWTIAATSVPPGTGTWKNGTGDGLWTTNTLANNNWATAIPSAATHIATFDNTGLSNAIGPANTVDLNGSKTIGGLNLSGNDYTIGLAATANTLTLDNGASAAAITASSGTQTINAKVLTSTTSDLNITGSAGMGTSLTLVQGITNANAARTVTLTQSGAGALSSSNIKNNGTLVFAANSTVLVTGNIDDNVVVNPLTTTTFSGTTTLNTNAMVTSNRVLQNTLNIHGNNTGGQNLATLTIASSTPNTVPNLAGNDGQISKVNTLAIDSSAGSIYPTASPSNVYYGKLDLTNNDLLITGMTLNAVTDMVRSGYNGGNWAGTGITSSVAGSSPANQSLYALGVYNFPAATTYHGSTTIDPNTILVKFTYAGDTNGDGIINLDDYQAVDVNINTAASGYQLGDTNYDGVVNLDDYQVIDVNIANGTATTIPLPEPSSFVLGFLGLLGLLLALRLRRKNLVSGEVG